ncbi:MAG: hypothetical protein JO263_08005 [Candidatus Eremiobacteraeota bacterium]|nr:hypothetical protein [Candidatus Eremiobacteraeota bacterium]
MRLTSHVTPVAYAFAAVVVGGCGGTNATPATVGYSETPLRTILQRATLKNPILVAFNVYKSQLVYWPIRNGGGHNPLALTAPLKGAGADIYSLAADGDVFALPNASTPGALLTYNLDHHLEKSISDPYGQPENIAIDPLVNVYLLDSYGGVTEYQRGTRKVLELTCPLVYQSLGMGADNEGDVFIIGYVPGRAKYHLRSAMWKISAGSQTCTALHLDPGRGTFTGIGVDPKTDDLIVLGTKEMVIYPKPYRTRTAVHVPLHAANGAMDFRLDAPSKHIFYSDDVFVNHQAFPIVDEADYPSGKFEGYYKFGIHANAGWIGGFITLPNTLPN